MEYLPNKLREILENCEESMILIGIKKVRQK